MILSACQVTSLVCNSVQPYGLRPCRLLSNTFQATVLEWAAMPLPRIIIKMTKEPGRRMGAQNRVRSF